MALNWTRTFLETQGDVPLEVEEEFRAAFPRRERAYILATHKAMFLANLSSNSLQAWLRRLRGGREEAPTVCKIVL